jgi:hypothetical protein
MTREIGRREATRLRQEIEEGIIEYYAQKEEDQARQKRRSKEHLCGTLITDPNDLLVILAQARHLIIPHTETSIRPQLLN